MADALERVAVKQAIFEQKYRPLWQAFDDLHAKKSPTTNKPARTRNGALQQKLHGAYPLVSLYQQVCEHYALAQQRHYSPALIAELHERVLAGHTLLYAQRVSYLHQFANFLLYTFPNQVRANARLFWLCWLLFYAPCVIMGVACWLNDDFIYYVMAPMDVANMESMYDDDLSRIGRESGTDVMMFGHYVQNNVGIDFQVYATGLFFGIGTLFFTLYNGVVIGAVAGHLTGKGFGETFWSFVVGHGSFELTAIVIAAMAGLKLATPLIAPAPYTRKDALKVAGKDSIQLILGAAFMTFIAAFIEAFWSAQASVPALIKYIVAAGLWAFVGWYLTYCGRQQGAWGAT